MSTFVIRRPAQQPSVWGTLPSWQPRPSAPQVPVVLERDGEDGVLVAEAPGLDPAADLSVRVVGDVLTVAGVRRSATGPVRREARFSRSARLPEGVGAGSVTARYEAGVLRVRVAGMFPAPVEPTTTDIAIDSDVARRAPVEQAEQATDQQA